MFDFNEVKSTFRGPFKLRCSILCMCERERVRETGVFCASGGDANMMHSEFVNIFLQNCSEEGKSSGTVIHVACPVD